MSSNIKFATACNLAIRYPPICGLQISLYDRKQTTEQLIINVVASIKHDSMNRTLNAQALQCNRINIM